MPAHPIDYATPATANEDAREPGSPLAAALVVIAAALTAIAGALLVGFGSLASASGGSDRWGENAVITGIFVLVVAAVILVVGFVQWIRIG